MLGIRNKGDRSRLFSHKHGRVYTFELCYQDFKFQPRTLSCTGFSPYVISPGMGQSHSRPIWPFPLSKLYKGVRNRRCSCIIIRFHICHAQFVCAPHLVNQPTRSSLKISQPISHHEKPQMDECDILNRHGGDRRKEILGLRMRHNSDSRSSRKIDPAHERSAGEWFSIQRVSQWALV